MKKLYLFLLLGFLSGGLFGCVSNESTNTDDKTIDELKIGFVPSRPSDEILETTKPLEEMIKTEMAKTGYTVNKVSVDVGASYEAVGESLSSGTTDIGFIPGGTYVLYEDSGVQAILTATRAGLNKDFEDAKSWNDKKETKMVEDAVTYYRSLIVAGPSDKGIELSKKVNNSEKLTFDDIKDANICLASPSSSSGYLYPLQKLKDDFGKEYEDLENPVTTSDYGDSLAKLAASQCDISAIYADARLDYADAWMDTYNREKSIWEETNVIAVTDGIMNDTISISQNSDVYSPEFIEAFDQAMINIGNTEEGKKIISIYSHEGYEKTNPDDYNEERKIQQTINGE